MRTKVEVQYHYTLLGGTNAKSFAETGVDKAVRFFGNRDDMEVVVVVTTMGSGANEQYRGDCVATKKIEVVE